MIDLPASEAPIFARDLNCSEQRALALHLLYTMEMNEYENSLAAEAYQYERSFKVVIEPEDQLFKDIQDIIEYGLQADEIVKPLLEKWKFDRISIMARLILRYAIWELNIRKSDAALAINEAIELSKSFGETDSYRFIHGVLDSLVKQMQPIKTDLPDQP